MELPAECCLSTTQRGEDRLKCEERRTLMAQSAMHPTVRTWNPFLFRNIWLASLSFITERCWPIPQSWHSNFYHSTYNQTTIKAWKVFFCVRCHFVILAATFPLSPSHICEMKWQWKTSEGMDPMGSSEGRRTPWCPAEPTPVDSGNHLASQPVILHPGKWSRKMLTEALHRGRWGGAEEELPGSSLENGTVVNDTIYVLFTVKCVLAYKLYLPTPSCFTFQQYSQGKGSFSRQTCSVSQQMTGHLQEGMRLIISSDVYLSKIRFSG